MEQTDQTKDQQKYTKKTVGWNEAKTKSRPINGKGKKTYNSAKEILSRASLKSGYTCGAWRRIIRKRKNNHCGHYVK